eukprot:99986_1
MYGNLSLSNPVLFVIIILNTIISFSLGVILAYSLSQFAKVKTNLLITRRHGSLVLSYNVFAILLLFVGVPFSIFSNLIATPNTSTLIDSLDDVIFDPLYSIYLGLFLLRHWIIYYDIQFASSCLHSEWTKIINSNAEIVKNEKWYIKHRQTIGNISYMSKRIVIISLIIAAVSVALALLSSPLDMMSFHLSPHVIWTVIVFICIAMFCIILYLKTPAFNDNIYLYEEWIMLSRFWFLSIALYIASAVLGTVLFNGTWIAICVEYVAVMFGIFVVPFVSTWWVLKQIKSVEIATQMQHKTPIDLRDILEDKDFVLRFIEHLINEFSIQNVLALIELNQYKLHLMKELNIKDGLAFQTNTVASAGFTCIAFAEESIPKSDIVYCYNSSASDNPLLMYKTKAHKLFTKYIQDGAELEVHIASKERLKLVQLMGNYNAWISVQNRTNEMALVEIFDDVMSDLERVLSHSKARFKFED